MEPQPLKEYQKYLFTYNLAKVISTLRNGSNLDFTTYYINTIQKESNNTLLLEYVFTEKLPTIEQRHYVLRINKFQLEQKSIPLFDGLCSILEGNPSQESLELMVEMLVKSLNNKK